MLKIERYSDYGKKAESERRREQDARLRCFHYFVQIINRGGRAEDLKDPDRKVGFSTTSFQIPISFFCFLTAVF